MTRKKFALIALSVVSALAAIGFFAIPAILGFDSVGPPGLAIGDRAEESIAEAVGREDGAQPAELTPGAEAIEVDEDGTIRIENADGAWVLVGDSVAGYRVFKDFVGLSEFEAVGRTSSITGDLNIDDDVVTDAEFQVNLATVTSDDPRRDAQFTGPILQTSIFAFATFNLTSPIDLNEAALAGEAVEVDATGDLTLKGVTQEVDVALTARLVGDEVQVSGSIDVVFEDFDIDPPFTPSIVVRDEGIIEFSLFFEQLDVA